MLKNIGVKDQNKVWKKKNQEAGQCVTTGC